MITYIEIVAAIVIVILLWYTVFAMGQKEYMRGYVAGMQHIRCGLQLKVLRQRTGLSLGTISTETGLEPELIHWIEENDYTKLVDFDYKQITDILFDYYGVDQQAGTFYVRFDKEPIKIKPCNGFHPIDKVPAKTDTKKNPLYTIQEPAEESKLS